MSDYVDSGYVDPGYFGQPGSLCAFIMGSRSLLFDQAPQRPARADKLIQAEARSTGGDTFGYPAYATDRMLKLRWPRMYVWYLRRLLTWDKAVSMGMAETFTWRDLSGQLTTVRFDGSGIRYREVSPDRYEVEISLWVAA